MNITTRKLTTTKTQHSIEHIDRVLTKNVNTLTEREENNINNFTSLLRAYEEAYRVSIDTVNDENLGNIMLELAKAIAYGVVRKVFDVSGDSTIDTLRKNIYIDYIKSKNMTDTLNRECNTRYNNDGVCYTETENTEAVDKVVAESLSDSLDLVNTACEGLLEQSLLVNVSTPCFLENEYETEVIKKRVLIKDENKDTCYENVLLIPIQEVYRKVRRYISKNAGVRFDCKNEYIYLDSYDDGGEALYVRIGKYYDINGDVLIHMSSTENTDENNIDIDETIDMLELTERQEEILRLRLKENYYGKQAIATYLDVKPSSVDSVIKGIQKKALKTMNVPAHIVASLDESHKTVYKIDKNDYPIIKKMHENGYSYGYIASIYNVSKATISYIIKGRKDR